MEKVVKTFTDSRIGTKNCLSLSLSLSLSCKVFFVSVDSTNACVCSVLCWQSWRERERSCFVQQC